MIAEEVDSAIDTCADVIGITFHKENSAESAVIAADMLVMNITCETMVTRWS